MFTLFLFSSTNVLVASASDEMISNTEICSEQEIKLAMEELNKLSNSGQEISVKVNDNYILSKQIIESQPLKIGRATYQKNVEANYKLTSILGITVGSATVYASFQYDYSTVTALSCSGIVSSTFPGISAETISQTISSGTQSYQAWGKYKYRLTGNIVGVQVGSKEGMVTINCTASGIVSDSISG